MNLGTMPLVNDYSLCTQMVSIYHVEGSEVTRTVIYPAYLDFKKTETTEKTGSQEANSFLLVIPCHESPVAIGDKVMAGEGPVVDSEDQLKWWRNFIPTKHVGLGVVKSVDPKYWNGEMCHVEAGG
jgi:hypothetical protein